MAVDWLVAAEAELEDAMAFCEAQRSGRAAHLLRCVGDALQLILDHPGAGRLYGEGQTEVELRRVGVPRFPYGLVYRMEPRLVVLALAHERQRPEYWIDRVV